MVKGFMINLIHKAFVIFCLKLSVCTVYNYYIDIGQFLKFIGFIGELYEFRGCLHRVSITNKYNPVFI